MASSRIAPETGHAPLLQMALARFPFLKRVYDGAIGLSAGGSTSTDSLTLASPAGNYAPAPTRYKPQSDTFEMPDKKGNYGSLIDPENDPEGRGTAIENAQSVGNYEAWDIYQSDGFGPSPIAHAPASGLTDDITDLVQSINGEAHNALRSLHANFPGAPVVQFPPQTISVVLAPGIPSEIVLPDLAVIARISWTLKASNDLWVSLQGAAHVPLAAELPSGANSSEVANKGMILNPDDGKYFYVKSIKSFSAICANACIVSVQCYLNN